MKGLSWWQTLLAAIGAVGLVFAARKVTRLEGRAELAETEAEKILHDETTVFIDRADTLLNNADKDKLKAKNIRADMEKSLESLAKNDTTLDELAHHFNSRRLRRDAGGPTELGPGRTGNGSA